MTREEFIRRWEALPEIKRAELIDGIVYMPSPVSGIHGSCDYLVHMWLGQYTLATPGCRGETGSTWFMGPGQNAPQPDITLALMAEYGGKSRIEGIYSSGVPELAVEICYSSTDYDLGPKLNLYQASGVPEYIAVLTLERKVIWLELVDGRYRPIEPDADGVLRSRIFPGLWLDPAALLAGDTARLAAVGQRGIASPEHAEFVRRLAEQRERRN